MILASTSYWQKMMHFHVLSVIVLTALTIVLSAWVLATPAEQVPKWRPDVAFNQIPLTWKFSTGLGLLGSVVQCIQFGPQMWYNYTYQTSGGLGAVFVTLQGIAFAITIVADETLRLPVIGEVYHATSMTCCFLLTAQIVYYGGNEGSLFSSGGASVF